MVSAMTAWERVKQESLAAIDRINSALSGDRGEPERTLPVFDRDADLQRALEAPIEDEGIKWRRQMAELDEKRRKARAEREAAEAAPPQAVVDRQWRTATDTRPEMLPARPGATYFNHHTKDLAEEYFHDQEGRRNTWGPIDHKLNVLRAIRFRDLPDIYLVNNLEYIKSLSMRYSLAIHNMVDGPERAAALDKTLGELLAVYTAPARGTFPKELEGVADRFDRLAAMRVQPGAVKDAEANLKRVDVLISELGNAWDVGNIGRAESILDQWIELWKPTDGGSHGQAQSG
jgi:hypothetical protein